MQKKCIIIQGENWGRNCRGWEGPPRLPPLVPQGLLPRGELEGVLLRGEMGGFTPTIIPHVVYAMHDSRQQSKKLTGGVVDTTVLESYYQVHKIKCIRGVMK